MGTVILLIVTQTVKNSCFQLHLLSAENQHIILILNRYFLNAKASLRTLGFGAPASGRDTERVGASKRGFAMLVAGE